MTDYKLSIIIPVFNKWNFTKACLNDLSKLPQNHQIIIVDNGSSDETQLEINKLNMPNLIYSRNYSNFGFAVACNMGFDWAKSDNIMFLNNDIRVKSNWSDWTNIIINSIEDNCLVGPTAGYVDPSNNFKFCYETSDIKKPINYMSGWCLSANRNTLKKLKIERPPCLIYDHQPPTQIFSEEFGLAYFEDADLGHRSHQLGINFKLVQIPVVHFGKISSGQLNTNALYSKARQIFINKWNSKK